jgi:ATP-binding cassette subfamily C protein LapB
MLAALFINVLSLSGIVFSMQVYDRVIPPSPTRRFTS